MSTSTEPERTRTGMTERPGWLAAAATIAGLAGIGMAIYQVATPGPPGSDFDSWDDFVLRDGLLLVYLLASIAAVTGARRAGLATRVSARLVAVGYGLISVGVAASLALREDPEWFFALGGPGILLSAAGFIVLAVSGVRRSRLPVWAALLAGVGGLVAIVMSELGTTVLVASFWLYVASITHRSCMR